VGYQGTRPVYPGALYLLSALLPEDFPSTAMARWTALTWRSGSRSRPSQIAVKLVTHSSDKNPT